MHSKSSLCGLDTIGDARQVILVGSQDCRDKLASTTGRVVVSWAGGTQGVKHADWTPLRRRNVVIWPDADGPGLATAEDIAAILGDLGATVRVMDVMRDNPPNGWDAADAIDDGWGKDECDNFMRDTVQAWKPKGDNTPAQFETLTPLPASLQIASAVDPAGNLKDAPDMLRAGQVLGVERFDVELETSLIDRGWRVRLNRLSGHPEIHLLNGVVPMTDERLAEIRFTVAYASNGKEPAKDKIADAVGLIAERRAYHPVLDYLDGLKWDGVERLNQWLIRYLGADDTPLNRAFGRKILCAAVRRVKNPGCKFDAMLVIEGAQDIGKSSAIAALCPDREWFTDQLEVGADPKVTIEKTTGAWLIEMPELDGMGKRDTNRVKSFITTTDDRARLAYGRYAVTRPRQFILFGTTNESHYLNDLTGNRRFWIVRAIKADVADLAAIRDQLWAEAVQAEPAEKLWLDDQALRSAAAEVTREASEFGPWMELLEDRIPAGPLKIEVADVWKLVGIDGAETINKLTKAHHVNMKAAMAGLGFEKRVLRSDSRSLKTYVRGGPDAGWWRPGELPPDNQGELDRW